MKKLLLIIIAFALYSTPSFAINDVIMLEKTLEAPYTITINDDNIETKEKTLKEKLLDIYHAEIEYTNKPAFLLSDILTKKFDETSVWDNLHLWGAYNADLSLNFIEDDNFNGYYNFNYINLGLDGALKNNNGDFRLMLNVSPLSSRNFAQALFADAYIATNKIPHHRIWVGNTRPPVGYEGGYSPFLLPFVARSQIARNFGTIRKLGGRIKGNYSLVDYDLGVYSSDTYFQSFFPGTEFVGWVNFKPLGKTNDKYGKLTIGGGIQSGQRTCDYTVTGAYIGYEYKKWLLNFEYSDANGYNGTAGHSIDKHASGFYSTLAYKINPKLQALIRYDEFDPNKDISHNDKREYTAGLNYFIKGQAVKLMLNYIYCQNQSQKDSHRLILGTQLVL